MLYEVITSVLAIEESDHERKRLAHAHVVITSYSIHYTKLYERKVVVKRFLLLAAGLVLSLGTPQVARAVDTQLVAGAGPSTVIAQLFFDAFSSNPAAAGLEFVVPAISVKHAGGVRSTENRITSYNVCYTKLLRNSCVSSNAIAMSLTPSSRDPGILRVASELCFVVVFPTPSKRRADPRNRAATE